MCKTPFFWYVGVIIGENPTKCWFSVNTSDTFTVFTTNFDVEKKEVSQYFLVQG